jgi:predicted amidohydrolase YtcJ
MSVQREDTVPAGPVIALRWSVTHAEGITAAHLDRARRLGVTVQLPSQGVIGATAAAPAPLRLLRDSGLSWGLGTDGTRAARVSPFVTLWRAATGQSLGGERTLDAPLTREEALIAHTRRNAHLMFRENDLGSIRPGLLADLLVLDRDLPHRRRRRDQGHHPARHHGPRLDRLPVTVPAWESG